MWGGLVETFFEICFGAWKHNIEFVPFLVGFDDLDNMTVFQLVDKMKVLPFLNEGLEWSAWTELLTCKICGVQQSLSAMIVSRASKGLKQELTGSRR